jgi:hypothetical protein
MMWFLTKYEFSILCRWSSTEHIEFNIGHCCRRRRTGHKWNGGAVCLRRSPWRFSQQMDGILAIKFRFNSMTLLFVSQLFTISLCSWNTEVWLVITDSYMHWSMQAGILINIFPFWKNYFLLLSKICKIKRISVWCYSSTQEKSTHVIFVCAQTNQYLKNLLIVKISNWLARILSKITSIFLKDCRECHPYKCSSDLLLLCLAKKFERQNKTMCLIQSI